MIKNLILASDFKRITNLIVDTKDIVELELSDITKELGYEDIEDIKDEKLNAEMWCYSLVIVCFPLMFISMYICLTYFN